MSQSFSPFPSSRLITSQHFPSHTFLFIFSSIYFYLISFLPASVALSTAPFFGLFVFESPLRLSLLPSSFPFHHSLQVSSHSYSFFSHSRIHSSPTLSHSSIQAVEPPLSTHLLASGATFANLLISSYFHLSLNYFYKPFNLCLSYVLT